MNWYKLMEFGAKTGCHQRADRSFYFRNYQFPLCARCTGIFVTTFLGYFLYYKKKPGIKIGILFVIPMMIDGIIQLLRIKESTNLRRLITGMLGGIGLVLIRMNLYKMFVKK